MIYDKTLATASIGSLIEKSNMITLDNPINIISNNGNKRVFDPMNMPEILINIDQKFMKKITPDVPRSCRLNMLLAKTVEMVSSKRIVLKEIKNKKILNHYAICFMPSGSGKDRTINELNNHIFNKFHEYLKNKVAEYRAKQIEEIEMQANEEFQGDGNYADKQRFIKQEKAKLRNLVFEINIATPEGFAEDAKCIKDAGFGCILVKVSELGLMLNNKQAPEIAFLNMLYQATDGIIESKSIKTGQRIETVEGIPINAILFSDPTMFEKQLNSFFELLMQTGLIRRSFLTVAFNYKKSIEEDPDKAFEIYTQAYNDAEVLSNEIFNIFKEIPSDAAYELTETAYKKTLHPYKVEITHKFNDVMDKGLLQKEINSREMKVLKMACLFATLNHPKDLYIREKDIEQAINVVEYLSLDFEAYLKHKPKSNDAYDNMFEFFKENLDIHFNKTPLVNMYNRFGFGDRADFRANFDYHLDIICDMALENGYILNKEEINNNTGLDIYLTKAPTKNHDTALESIL